MDPGIGPLFTQTRGCLECGVKMWERQHLLFLHSSRKNAHTKFHNSTLSKNRPNSQKQSPVESPTVATYPFTGEQARLTGASSKGGKCAESPPTFICGKRRKNRRKPVKMKILSSGVVVTLEEDISTSHICLKGQQP